ncbi:MAG: DUF2283 domain-containing protein [Patescibacteria group bacterium]|nr:hypothetical protein [Patescibacteria group bacterium]MDE1944159.1 DUF2283 domain-containing protein [Patescibacteria group bacterium]MDE1945091.1 DUF2283 domain-containing protein [Patescibacteria group bacterium]MDE2057885.1 DUF2283 domain-containing protein [Patescibacteria group bacterium]
MVNYFYDKEADVFYFSEGAPRASDQTVEAGNDVLLRVAPRTKHVRGFTLLNASRRLRDTRKPIALPFTLTRSNA